MFRDHTAKMHWVNDVSHSEMIGKQITASDLQNPYIISWSIHSDSLSMDPAGGQRSAWGSVLHNNDNALNQKPCLLDTHGDTPRQQT